MLSLVILLLRLYFKLLKLLFKVICFTGVYMILLGSCVGMLISGGYNYNVHPNVYFSNMCFIGGAIVGGVFCLYIFARNIARLITHEKKLGIVQHIRNRKKVPEFPQAPN